MSADPRGLKHPFAVPYRCWDNWERRWHSSESPDKWSLERVTIEEIFLRWRRSHIVYRIPTGGSDAYRMLDEWIRPKLRFRHWESSRGSFERFLIEDYQRVGVAKESRFWAIITVSSNTAFRAPLKLVGQMLEEKHRNIDESVGEILRKVSSTRETWFTRVRARVSPHSC